MFPFHIDDNLLKLWRSSPAIIDKKKVQIVLWKICSICLQDSYYLFITVTDLVFEEKFIVYVF